MIWFYDSELFQGERDGDVTSDKQNTKALTTSKALFLDYVNASHFLF